MIPKDHSCRHQYPQMSDVSETLAIHEMSKAVLVERGLQPRGRQQKESFFFCHDPARSLTRVAADSGIINFTTHDFLRAVVYNLRAREQDYIRYTQDYAQGIAFSHSCVDNMSSNSGFLRTFDFLVRDMFFTSQDLGTLESLVFGAQKP